MALVLLPLLLTLQASAAATGAQRAPKPPLRSHTPIPPLTVHQTQSDKEEPQLLPNSKKALSGSAP